MQKKSFADSLTVREAFDGSIINTLRYTPWSEAEAMLERAVKIHNDVKGRPPAWRRIEILHRLAELLRHHKTDFAMLIAREGGKPLRDAQIEVERAVKGIEIAADSISHLHGREIPMDLSAASMARLAFTRMEPIGPVVAISAFNHPLNLIVHQVVPAIATGCPVIIKPADTTPFTCKKFIDLVHEAGLHPALCQLCICDIPTAEKLAIDARVAFFSFIGSSKVGWYLRSKLAPGTRCALEHGGAAPVIICDDADISATVRSLVKGGYYHAGQVCVSVQRIFVDNAIKDSFLDAYTTEVAKLTTGDPKEESTDVGPLILPREVDRVEAWVNEAIAGGAIVTTGAARKNDYLFEPTVLVDPQETAKVSQQEIFGPVTCVFGFKSIEKALTLSNSLPIAFHSAVFTQQIDRALDLSTRLNASAVLVNDHTAFRTDWMPFAGRKSSGLGVGGIPYTMEEMMQAKMITFQAASI